VVESNTSQAHFFYVSTCRDVKKWLVSTTQSDLHIVAIPSFFYLPFQDLPQELRIDFIASCDKDCLWCVKTIRTVLWIIYKPQYPCACVMCQKSPSWQRQNHMSSGWKKDIQRALIVPSIIITKHGKSDAMRVIIFYTWQHFLRWKNRDKNEMKLHWQLTMREWKTMATFYYTTYLMLRLRAAEGKIIPILLAT